MRKLWFGLFETRLYTKYQVYIIKLLSKQFPIERLPSLPLIFYFGFNTIRDKKVFFVAVIIGDLKNIISFLLLFVLYNFDVIVSWFDCEGKAGFSNPFSSLLFLQPFFLLFSSWLFWSLILLRLICVALSLWNGAGLLSFL